MSKSLFLPILACFAFTGCALFQKSPTWDKVVRSRIDVPREGDTSRIYAEGLHHELKAARIEHKVVTYQYRYRSRLRDDAISERTAVIYRDDSNPTYPWWIKDERSGRPTWLPNAGTQQQIRFYVGRDVEIVGPEDGKQIAPPERHRHHAKNNASSKREAQFRATHGTAFNPASALDREKMSALLRAPNAIASIRTF